ncbi:MAG: hypothetical protein K5894_09580 [Lachnospiraceae bacterium]|nr:hypothetical protein [Lachnospiraceae bacterium]
MKSFNLLSSRSEENVDSTDRSSSFSKVLEEKEQKCPYSCLAKDGVIEYNGVVFVCDYKTNSICLGDMSDSKNVLNICLPSGGNLKVNVENIGDLSKAAGMFSPADLNAIMRAIAKYNYCTKKREADLSDAIKNYENAHKLSAAELKEEKDWRDMSSEEWDKMLEGFDKYIDDFKERLRKLKEMEDEVAQKAAMEADPEMRAIAAASAALAAAAGFDAGSSAETEEAGEVSSEDKADHENNWTKKLKTDDQTILMIAKEAQKMESHALSKYQEVQLFGTGITDDRWEWVR